MSVCLSRWNTALGLKPCPSLSHTLSPDPPGTETMASKPEKRVASSVFITLAPPRRNMAVAEEVKRAACEARPGRPWEAPAPGKAPGDGSAGRSSPWTPPARAAATRPAVSPQLSNGGKKVRGPGRRLCQRPHGGGEERTCSGLFQASIHSSSTYCVPGRLKPTRAGLNPGSSTWLCEVGKPHTLSVPLFPNL